MKGLFVFFLFSWMTISAQTFDKNENLKTYKTIKLFHYSDNAQKSEYWTKYIVENGRVVENESYRKHQLTARIFYIYDAKNNIKQEIKTYDINLGKIQDTISYDYVYNEIGQLVEKKNSMGNFEIYSDFNKNNLPQTIETPNNKFDSISGYREVREFYPNGNIKLKSIYSKVGNLENQEISEYKYDNQNNIIEISRKYIPNQDFPIIMTGGRSLYPKENFRYIYNEKGLWIKQFLIVNKKEILLNEREFK